MRIVWLLMYVWVLVAGSSVLVAAESAGIQTIFGQQDEVDPLVAELLASSAFQRLKEVDQGGIAHYYHALPAVESYDHAVGVYKLLCHYGASGEECLAGLLQSVIQPAIINIADPLFLESTLKARELADDPNIELLPGFNGQMRFCYAVHRGYLQRQGIEKILAEHHLTVSDLWAERPVFKMLNASLPDVSLQRLETTLRTGYLWGLISLEECEQIVNTLHFYEGNWVFTDLDCARRLGYLSLHLTQNAWADETVLIANYWGEQAIRQALNKKLVTLEEIHFGSDRAILNQIEHSRNHSIQQLLARCQQPFKWCYRIKAEEKGIHLRGIFYGFNPLLWMRGKAVRLADVDADYAQKYQQVRAFVENGVHVALFNYAR